MVSTISRFGLNFNVKGTGWWADPPSCLGGPRRRTGRHARRSLDTGAKGGGVARPPQEGKNHSTQGSRVVPHRGTNWAALRLTAQIGRDAVLSESYGRGWWHGASPVPCGAGVPGARPDVQRVHKGRP